MLTEVTKGTLTQKRREVQRLHSAVLCPSTFNDILGGVEVKLLFHFEKSLENFKNFLKKPNIFLISIQFYLILKIDFLEIFERFGMKI